MGKERWILILLAAALIWPECQDWKENEHDRVALVDRLPTRAGFWECAALRSKMAQIDEQWQQLPGARARQDYADIGRQLQQKWRNRACDMTLQ